jgi:hypothetical protein
MPLGDVPRRLVHIPRHLLHIGFDELSQFGVPEPKQTALASLFLSVTADAHVQPTGRDLPRVVPAWSLDDQPVDDSALAA